MKKHFTHREKHKLPLTFKYIDVVKSKSREKNISASRSLAKNTRQIPIQNLILTNF